jgi:glycosyltransferase involved in cell wall biosynthesis
MQSNVIIVSHVFPPSPGIGGRRWAKFGKYLKYKGYDIGVISADKLGKSVSSWIEDVNSLKVETLPFRFPKIVAYPCKGFLNKINYFISLCILKLIDKGNYFDKTIFWKKQIQKRISELIDKDKTNVVIVTVGPFRLAHQVVSLKKTFPNVKFIVDFRDYWTHDSEITAFSGLSEKRKKYERYLEKETILLADKVIVVAGKMKQYFEGLEGTGKVHVIPNGFDPEDFTHLTLTKNEVNSDSIKFVFTGTLYINLDYILHPFFDALRKIKEDYPEIYSRIKIEFIGTFPRAYIDLIRNYGVSDSVLIFDELPLKEIYSKINSSQFCLLFLNDVYSFSLSTKFCEYISQKKKIVVVSSKGEAAEFVVDNKLGFWINPENAFSDLLNLIKLNEQGKAAIWNTDFDINKFSLKNLTDELIQLIEN